MGWAVVFLALFTYCTGIDCQTVWTQAPSTSVSLGGTVTLSCTTTQSTYSIAWYQQKSREGPRFVHCDACSRGEGIPGRFTATRSGSTGFLAITNVEAEDEADFFCGSWDSAVNRYVFGTGTQMTVGGQPTVSPTVRAFSPPQEDIRRRPRSAQDKVTLVCLISDFYPANFNLKWKADGNLITSGVETSKATKQGDKYLASSYLSLPPSVYGKSNLYTCEVTHEGKTITKSVSPSGSC